MASTSPGCIFSIAGEANEVNVFLRPHAVNLSPKDLSSPSIERASVDVGDLQHAEAVELLGQVGEVYIHVPYNNLAHAKGQSVEISRHTNGTSHKTHTVAIVVASLENRPDGRAYSRTDGEHGLWHHK